VTGAGFGFGTDAVATGLAEFIAASGLETAAVVGHSWGGGFALRLVSLTRIRGHLIVGAGPRKGVLYGSSEQVSA
jgi:pimeloyl-ACP methyl ester carboxylesterase